MTLIYLGVYMMIPVLSILIVWILTTYFKQYFCPRIEVFEKYTQWLDRILLKFIKHEQVKKITILLLPLLLFSVIYYDLKIKHFYLFAFLINTFILWYGCIYQKKIEILSASLTAQEEEIFFRPLFNSFTVIFWFLMAGPLGVLFYDFVRRMELHPLNQLLEWPAARVLGFGYALAGHFSPVFSYWSHHFFEDMPENQNYIKNCGALALYGNLEPHSVNEKDLDSAKSLVRRAKFMLFLVVLVFSMGTLH